MVLITLIRFKRLNKQRCDKKYWNNCTVKILKQFLKNAGNTFINCEVNLIWTYSENCAFSSRNVAN